MISVVNDGVVQGDGREGVAAMPAGDFLHHLAMLDGKNL